jgi:hypothetical protein
LELNEQIEDIASELRDAPFAEFTRQLGGTTREPGALGRIIQRYLDELVAADLVDENELAHT